MVAALPSAPSLTPPQARRGGGNGTGTWDGGTVALQEEEVIKAIRLLTRFGEVGTDPNASQEALQQELTQVDPNTRLNLQQLLGSLAAKVGGEQDDTPLLMKAAEHMAIRFALERFQKGEVKVNAVHQMLEHMSRQMDTLRQILRIQEDKMGKAGILVESHADILDRLFWAEVPEAGKKSVLLSSEAPCVPARNMRQFLEVLLERGDRETASAILENYVNCLGAKDIDPRRKTATGIGQLADLFAQTGAELMANTVTRLGEVLAKEPDQEVQSLLSAAFVRISTECCSSSAISAGLALGERRSGKVKRAGGQGVHVISSDLRSLAAVGRKGAWAGLTNMVARRATLRLTPTPWPLPVQVARVCRFSCPGSWLDGRRQRPVAPRTPCPAARTPAPARRVPATAPRVPPPVRRPRATGTPTTHMHFATPSFADSGPGLRFCGMTRVLPQAPRCAID